MRKVIFLTTFSISLIIQCGCKKESETFSYSTPIRDNNMALGNPSNAIADRLNMNNYLMIKPQYALSYNNSKGSPNWVSWHLSPAWEGSAFRCDCFSTDATLPPDFYHTTPSDFTSSGFDRIPQTTKELNEEQQIEINKLLDKIEEDDDVLTVYHNIA